MKLEIYPTYQAAANAIPVDPSLGRALLNESKKLAEQAKDDADQGRSLEAQLAQSEANRLNMESRLADRGGLRPFAVLVDIETGQVVAERLMTLPNKFAGQGSRRVWLVQRAGADEWVTDYKRSGDFARKGLIEAYVVAPAFVGSYGDDPEYKLPTAPGDGMTPTRYYSIRKTSSYQPLDGKPFVPSQFPRTGSEAAAGE